MIIFSSSTNLSCLLHLKIIGFWTLCNSDCFSASSTPLLKTQMLLSSSQMGERVGKNCKMRILSLWSKKSWCTKCQFHAKVTARQELQQNGQSKRLCGCLFQTQDVQACISSLMALYKKSFALGTTLSVGWERISRLRKVILPLCSALMRPCLDYSTHLCASGYKKGMDLL